MEQQTYSKQGNEYVKAVYCHLAYLTYIQSSVQFSHSVVSDSLQHHEPQHARPPCTSTTPRVHPNPCPLSRWCHPTISSCRLLLNLPSIFPSIRVFSNESALHIRWPKYCSFSFNISPSSEHPIYEYIYTRLKLIQHYKWTIFHLNF